MDTGRARLGTASRRRTWWAAWDRHPRVARGKTRCTRAVRTSASSRSTSASERLPARAGEPVVSAPLLRLEAPRRSVGLLDPAGLHQSLERAVERAWPEADFPVRLPEHVLEDAIAVSFTAGQ